MGLGHTLFPAACDRERRRNQVRLTGEATDPFEIIDWSSAFCRAQRARTDRRPIASLSTSGRLQNANRTMVRPSSGWSS